MRMVLGGRARRSRVVVAAGSAVLIGFAGSVTATAAPVSEVGVPPGFAEQELRWRPCPSDLLDHALAGGGYAAARSAVLPGLDCARIRTPLDWAHPADGREATFWISRLPGTGSATTPLLTSTGGSGAGTLLDPHSFSGGMPKLRESFDLVGFDARGTSTSSTAQSCDPAVSGDPGLLGTGPREGYDILDFSAPSVARQLDDARRWTERCLAGAATTPDGASTAPYVTYWQTVRDLDLVRQLLRADKWSYLGVSQGTALGRELARTFPGHVDRWVLDSVVDPLRSPNAVLQERYRARQQAVETEFAPWAATRGTVLGDNADRVLASITKLRADLAVRPIRLPGGQAFTANDLNPILFGVGNAANEAVLSKLLTIRAAVQGGSSPASVQAVVAMVSQFQLSPLIDRELGAVLSGAPRQGWWTAYNCNAAEWSHDTNAVLAEQQWAAEQAPLTYLGMGFSAVCAQWPFPGRADSQSEWGEVPGMLLITNERDAVTPAGGARALRDLVAGSRLVTVEGKAAHLVLPQRTPFGLPGGVPGTSSCATDIAVRYLTAGELPPKDQTCKTN
ncbi:pimeloyl-ACP methyl ester carboxylesterase [Rhodococcus sp. PvR099]|nr:pimeloyl-ACP methyl ester carboxylesterase [Rhodococcus sp. PvR099]